MGLFDFLKKKVNSNNWAKPKEKTVQEAPKKRDLGVCVPVHARTPEERKKLKGKKEVSPFDKLRLQHLKETNEFNKEFKEISEQESEEPYEYEPELGVESVETKTSAPANNASQPVFDQNDELDVASQKLNDGYVPRFSSTARKKLGLEEDAPKKETRVVGSFEVTGTYVGAETMISGVVTSGKITKRMTATFGKGTLRISDLKRGSSSVSELLRDEEGTIFVRGNASNIKYGDIIDFS